MKMIRTTIVISPDVLDKLKQAKKITGITMGKVAGRAIELHWEEIVKTHMDKQAREKLSSLVQLRIGLKLKLGQIEREMDSCKKDVR